MAKYKMEKDKMDHMEAINAFVAMGGNYDGSGEIETQRLVAITEEFELNINISVFCGVFVVLFWK